MANDDWRIKIEVEEEEHATGFLKRLTGDLGDEARDLAEDLKAQQLVGLAATTTRSSSTPRPAQTPRRRTRSSRPSSATTGSRRALSKVEHWLDEEDRWDDEPPGETWEEEELERRLRPVGGARRVRLARGGRRARGAARDRGLQARAPLPVPHRRRREPRGRRRPRDPRCTARSSRAASSSYEVEPGQPVPIFGGLGHVTRRRRIRGARVCFRLRRSLRGNQSRARIS